LLYRRIVRIRSVLPLLIAATLAWASPAAAEPFAVVYDGMGTADGALVSGRAVNNDKGYAPEAPNESTWRKLGRSLSLLRSKPLGHTTVDLRIGERTFSVQTDRRGYFDLQLSKEELAHLGEGEHRIDARVRGSSHANRWSQGTFFLWPRNGTAVISDIDDTVLDSQIAKKLRLVTRTFTNNSRDMHTFAGAAPLFRKFRENGMPILFVSSSPSNLYSRLQLFLEQSGFPRAPMLLKRLALFGDGDRLSDHGTYKPEQLDRIAKLLPGYRFVLVGDSGEADPEIYEAFRARVGADRVEDIVIHDLGNAPKQVTSKAELRLGPQHRFRGYAQLRTHLETTGAIRPSTSHLAALRSSAKVRPRTGARSRHQKPQPQRRARPRRLGRLR